jgi:hypothetical protein
MSLKLNNVGLNRAMNPPTAYAALTNSKGEQVTVHVPLPHADINAITIGEIERLAKAEFERMARE